VGNVPEKICPQCHKANRMQALACLQCGTLFFNPRESTIAMRIDPRVLRLRKQGESGGTGALIPEKSILLQIRSQVERVIFEDTTEVVLGRADLSNPDPNRFDLARFGGHERGVSRAHAVLRYNEDKLTITDLASANGTSVNAEKLEPETPHVLKDGDEVILGSLAVRVRFETPKSHTEPLPEPVTDTEPPT